MWKIILVCCVIILSIVSVTQRADRREKLLQNLLRQTSKVDVPQQQAPAIPNCQEVPVRLKPFFRAGGNPLDGVIVSDISETTITVGINAKTGQCYPVHPDLLSNEVGLFGLYCYRLADVQIGMKVNIIIQRQHCVWIAIPKR